MKNPHAMALGKLGGHAKSEAKTQAARENGKKGGRPKKASNEAPRLMVIAKGWSSIPYCDKPHAHVPLQSLPVP